MIKVKTIDGVQLRDMFAAGAALLESKRERVDALNVFPVPDGDTGTNMSLTMNSAIKEVNQAEHLDAASCAAAMSKGALRGARGNSGVITSQLFRGFAKALEGVEKITPVQFAQALQRGAETAYKAVMKPKEGTILTVARVIAEEAVKQAKQAPDDYDALFNVILTAGDSILKKTQQMLPALTQAGVVDAGGKGLLYIYKGYYSALGGTDLPGAAAAKAEPAAQKPEDDFSSAENHPYGVDFEVQNLFPEILPEDIDSCRRRLNRIGDGASVSGDLHLVKIHVDTAWPDKALEFGLSLGELNHVQIINRLEQKRLRQEAPPEPQPHEPSKATGLVAVSLGEGFDTFFKEVGIDCIVPGGQTMNPSIDDIAQAIRKTDAKTVYVLPNNGNVILAAQQAATLNEAIQVVVIPTKNAAMGIAAAIAFDPDASPEENRQRMTEAAEHVRTGMVTYAVRDSEMDTLHIHQNDIIGLYNGKITRVGSNVHQIAKELATDMITPEDSLVSVYYGSDTPEADAQSLGSEISALYPDCEVSVQYGGQPLYYYLISVE